MSGGYDLLLCPKTLCEQLLYRANSMLFGLQSIMKVLLVVFLVGAASAFVERAEWEAFKAKHAKSYANPIEEFYRMKASSY